MDTLAFIARYEALLKDKGIPKMAFYKDCGISDAAVSQWRKGKTVPSMKSVGRIADYLGVTAEYLLTGIPPVDMFEVIEYLCRKNDVTLEQMCSGTGVSFETISDLKEKKISRLSYADQVAVANYFEISIDVFSEGVFEETLPNEADAQVIAGYNYLQNKKPTPVSESGLISPERQALLDAIKDMDEDTVRAVLEVVRSVKKLRGE